MRFRSLALALWAAYLTSCTTPPTSLTTADLPEHFEPVARLEDSLNAFELNCRRPVALTQDCTEGFLADAELNRIIHLPGVSIRAAATADGKTVVFFPMSRAKPLSGVTSTKLANYAHAAIERALSPAGIAIERTRALGMPGMVLGYLIEFEGDGYTALKNASAASPLPSPPRFQAANLASEDDRPSMNPWGGGSGALLVNAPPLVIDEARGFDAIFQVNCDSVFLFAQACSNWTGPKLELTFGSVSARVAATRAGDVLMIAGPSDFSGDFKRSFDPKLTDPVNLSTRAVLAALRARGFEAKRVRAAVVSRRGPVYAYVAEFDSDAFAYLRQRAAEDAKVSGAE